MIDTDLDGELIAQRERKHLKDIYGKKLTRKLCHTFNRAWSGRARPNEIQFAMLKARKAYREYLARQN